MSNNPCPRCDNEQLTGIEYSYEHPCRYDGISEWWCQKCTYRIGRWSEKVLGAFEHEPPFNGKHRSKKCVEGIPQDAVYINDCVEVGSLNKQE